MKKVLFVGALALFACVNGQQTSYGVKAGYALSAIQSDDLEEALRESGGGSINSKSGFYVGVLVEQKVNDKFGVQAELQYANLGGQVELTGEDYGLTVTAEDKFNFNQILIPLSAKYYITPQFALYGGPSLAFKAGYKSKITLKDHNIPREFINEINDEIREIEREQNKALDQETKSTAINLFIGGEYNIYNNVFAEARYTFGLTNYFKNAVDNGELKMNYFQIGLGYKF